jgi:peroxiredoxin
VDVSLRVGVAAAMLGVWLASVALPAQSPTAPSPMLPLDLSLPDHTGAPRVVRSMAGPAGTVIVSCSSLREWTCRAHLLELRRTKPAVAGQPLGVTAVIADRPAALAAFVRQNTIDYPLLSDPEGKLARALSLPAHTSAVVVADPGGRVKGRRVDTARERATIANVLAKAGAAPGVIPKRESTPELMLTAHLSDLAVAAGDVFALVLDVSPRPKMHLYAPGATGYRPVTVRLDAQPALSARALELPASETYFFAPLNERLPVYTRPFRVIQEVAVTKAAASLKDPNVAVSAQFGYQACNDELCFEPVSVPLHWRVQIGQPKP